MKTMLALGVSIALLLQIAAAPETTETVKAGASGPASRPSGPGKSGELAALEKKLLGPWHGGPCVGNYTFNADGTFVLDHYTPGNNTLTGTWSIRWDALPPTLVVYCKTSDFNKHDGDRAEYKYLGKPLEVKLLKLSSDCLVLQLPNYKGEELVNETSQQYERPAEK